MSVARTGPSVDVEMVHRPDHVGVYETALDQLGEAAVHVDVVVPGHGAVAGGLKVVARPAADRACSDALRGGEAAARRGTG
jgi:hypothetical protein